MTQLVEQRARALELAVVRDPDLRQRLIGGSSPAMLLAYMRCTVAAIPAFESRSAHKVAMARFGARVSRFIELWHDSALPTCHERTR